MSAARAADDKPPDWLDAARDPRSYPHGPERVETRLTHISRVFLAGGLVYKTKKAVRLPFVDASTLERRRFFCDEEVRLNRRLAPRTYLGVAALRRRGGGFAWDAAGETGDGEVAEWAVVMERLPDDRMLDALLRSGRAGAAELGAVAARIAAFHADAPAAPPPCGGASDVRALVLGNLHEAAAEASPADRVEEIERFLRAELADGERLDARARAGRVREGHGDLRPEHVCLLDGEVLAIDCVEFDAALRTTDVASEIAFLAAELDVLGLPDLGRGFVRAYADRAGDPEVARLLPLYACHRALVRAKIDGAKSREADLGAGDRAEAAARVRRYFRVARRRALPPPSPRLIAVCGVSGSGKSTLAAALGELLGARVASSDPIRKRLAGLEPEARVHGAAAAALYSTEATDRTYEALAAEAERALAGGGVALVDATFQRARHRRTVLEAAARRGVPALFVECRADEAECLRRIEARRARGGGASDATADVARRQMRSFEPLDELSAAARLVVDTTAGVDAAVEAVRARLAAAPQEDARAPGAPR